MPPEQGNASLGAFEDDGVLATPLVWKPASPCPADFAEPLGVLNFFDVSAFITAYNAQDPLADFAAPFGTLNFFDVSAFIAAYNAQDPSADLAEPFGAFNFFDVSAYISAYNAGCP